jgi:hypothetical protein
VSGIDFDPFYGFLLGFRTAKKFWYILFYIFFVCMKENKTNRHCIIIDRRLTPTLAVLKGV